MRKVSRILITGSGGMVGSVLADRLAVSGFTNLIRLDRSILDLRDQARTFNFFEKERPEYVFHLAAKVGGIEANRSFPAEFIYDNLAIGSNVLEAARRSGVKKVLVTGSSCMYPRLSPQPIKEDYLLTGPLEPTNEAYAVAKIATVKQAQYYSEQFGMTCISPVPCNLYGPNDNFDLQSSHVLSALVRRFVEAERQTSPSVTLWGTGAARREFLHVSDAVEALILLMEEWTSPEIVNVGSGTDVSIHDLALLVASKVGFKGVIQWDHSKPDGMPLKCMDVSKIAALGFEPKVSLEQGVEQVVAAYKSRGR